MGFENYYDNEDLHDDRDNFEDPTENRSEIILNNDISDSNSDVNAIGDSDDIKQINDAVDVLEKTETGRDISNGIKENDVSIKFDYIDAIAQFDTSQNEITINEDFKDADPSVLAAHLAHEGTHVQWNAQDIPDSIDQEYHAFKNEKEIWDATKGENTDEQCDWVSSMIAQGEADAKMQLRLMYRNLPEYA